MEDARPPTAPSTVFLGLMSVSLVLPRFFPTKYAPVSAAITQATDVSVATKPTVKGGRTLLTRLRTCTEQQNRPQAFGDSDACVASACEAAMSALAEGTGLLAVDKAASAAQALPRAKTACHMCVSLYKFVCQDCVNVDQAFCCQ